MLLLEAETLSQFTLTQAGGDPFLDEQVGQIGERAQARNGLRPGAQSVILRQLGVQVGKVSSIEVGVEGISEAE